MWQGNHWLYFDAQEPLDVSQSFWFVCAWMNACSLCRAERRFSKSQPSTPTLPPVGSGWTWFPAAACQHLPAGLLWLSHRGSAACLRLQMSRNSGKRGGRAPPAWVIPRGSAISGCCPLTYGSAASRQVISPLFPSSEGEPVLPAAFAGCSQTYQGKEQFTAGTALVVCLQSTVRVYDAIKRPCSVINHNMLCI